MANRIKTERSATGTLLVMVEVELLQAVKVAAVADRVTVRSVVEEALARWLRRRERLRGADPQN